MWLKKLFSKIASLFSAKSRGSVELAFDHVADALPVVAEVAQVLRTFVPGSKFAGAWVSVSGSYPALFDRDASDKERKLQALGAAADILRTIFPGLGVTSARIAVQLAYASFAGKGD